MTNPDFMALANAMGVHAIRCDSLADLPAKMKEFMEYDNSKPVLFEARVVKNEHVYPVSASVLHRLQTFADLKFSFLSQMIPAGKALHEGIVHPMLRPPPRKEDL